ncbi:MULTISPECIES: zinc-binding dehydrogenase [Streptomyces]|uniref:Oxidoreductase n=1 Tax=Streptomyces coelicolor (strain ATCC BAA-471 / A3(2) / M145) TaxID=100226 RepID=Q9RCW3_STRCO|nr:MULTISPECIES: zinc-binding dehydrogenase [Streptomyces]MDX2923206.1 zinc-binding dehydrogenase [Streptomyces sp. NRRL_B-16638]MYU40372.1 zinc-binding dehydrogenase [Streptomyces sp. SID7813]NSL79905.1 zinc-binding dehydrogenase [Streptomyces coelicolor]QFI41097.1 zinc-binding dehydrogenase [Streptomyces coelicolor A3(2)]QKN64766.1 zinc-binding dehydrogenase [Streptomyces coelicolor]
MNGTVPEVMRAAYIDAVGPADAIRYGELAVPPVGPTDVLVRVAAVAADPVDTFVRSGAYATPLPLPFVVGRDLVGEVAVAGPGAAGLAVGQRVWCNSLGHAGRQGSFAQYATVAAERLYPAPAGIDAEHLVAAAHPAASAWLALFRHGRLRAGETVYVGGGAGNVGGAAVALASRAGARVVATARAEDAAAVRQLGAAEVLDHHAPDLGARVRGAAPDGYDVHLDTSGHGVLAEAVDSLARGGRLVAMVGLGAGPAALSVGGLYTKDASIVGFAISNATAADLAEAARGVVGVLTDTPWRPRIADRLPLSMTAEAHRRLEAGEVRGRLVLRPS